MGAAGAQAAPAAQPVPGAQAGSVPDSPQQTTATFADWTLRCDRSAGVPACEIVQTLANQGRPVAQIAVGRAARGQSLHLSILVPPSVSLGQPPQLLSGAEKPPLAELAWRRCLPGGCFAEAVLAEDAVHHIRARTEPAQVVFQDGAGHTVALPFSPHGLPQALDALSKEDGA